MFRLHRFLANEEILCRNNSVVAVFRTPTEDGYTVEFVNSGLITFQEYKSGVLDGLFMACLTQITLPQTDIAVCGHVLLTERHRVSLLYGEDIDTDEGPVEFRIVAEAEFKEPFDFLKYETIPIDVGWEASSGSGPKRRQVRSEGRAISYYHEVDSSNEGDHAWDLGRNMGKLNPMLRWLKHSARWII